MTERIKEYFKKRFNKKATDIKIDVSYRKECVHCGYGKKQVGTAHLRDLSEDDSDSSSENASENDNYYSNDNESVIFNYWTGCLTYSDELSYE